MEILQVEEGLIIWETLAFLGLLVVLWRFAWGPLLGILEEREDTIRESVEKAEETRVKAEQLLEEYKQQIASAREEAQKIIEDGRKLGETMKDEVVRKSREEAEQIMARASQDIEREKELALAELQSRVADLTIGAASRVVGQILEKQGHEELIDQYLSEVGSLSEN